MKVMLIFRKETGEQKGEQKGRLVPIKDEQRWINEMSAQGFRVVTRIEV